ncbi:MAG: cytochrome oxidase subunit III [Crocinitomicaceae bacterium]|nr:cytochrome oxidase subunit III [Crocinitomicaceae bacterium]|tara:strand:- start:4700 stop:5296 length:597 start_codon:yes stop_codon:yes gene_type:complete
METVDKVVIDSPLSEEDIQKRKTRKPMMVVGMVAIVMMFAGFTSAYIISQSNGNWLTFALPKTFYVSTAILLVSSVTLRVSTSAVKKNDFSKVKSGLGLTFLLSIAFVVTQFVAYGNMIEDGYYFTGTNVSASYLYILTFLHLLHVVGGIIALLVSWVKSLENKYTANNKLGLELTAMYWHFLDALWIYLLLFLLFIR